MSALLNWFELVWAEQLATCTVHAISGQNSSERIKYHESERIAKVLLSNLYTVFPILFPTLQSSLVFLTHYPGARCIGWPNFSLCVSKICGDMVMKFPFQLLKLVRDKKSFTKDDFPDNCFLYSLICRKESSSINKTKVLLVGDHGAIWHSTDTWDTFDCNYYLQSYQFHIIVISNNTNLKWQLLIAIAGIFFGSLSSLIIFKKINPNFKSCLLIGGRWVSHSRRMVEQLYCYITLLRYFCHVLNFT